MASATCQAEGAQLAYIYDYTENSALMLLAQQSDSNFTWIGLSDIEVRFKPVPTKLVPRLKLENSLFDLVFGDVAT